MKRMLESQLFLHSRLGLDLDLVVGRILIDGMMSSFDHFEEGIQSYLVELSRRRNDAD